MNETWLAERNPLDPSDIDKENEDEDDDDEGVVVTFASKGSSGRAMTPPLRRGGKKSAAFAAAASTLSRTPFKKYVNANKTTPPPTAMGNKAYARVGSLKEKRGKISKQDICRFFS